MRHRTALFSARTPNVARARKTPHPLKKRKVRKLVTFKIKRLDVVKPLLLQKCNTQVTRMNDIAILIEKNINLAIFY